jgi:hypothetical protein
MNKKQSGKAFEENTVFYLLVGIDVCIEVVVVDCGKEAYIGEAKIKRTLFLI